MNLAVTITAARRADYLVKAIRAVRAAGYEGVIHVSVDCTNGRISWGVADAARGEVGTLVRLNDPMLGLWGPHNNARAAYEWAFADGAQAVLAIEDDCILSPDALEVVKWYLTTAADRYLLLSLGNNTPNAGGRPLDVWESCHINSPWAWCFTREAWEWMAPKWNYKRVNPIGWDWSLSFRMANERRKSLVPALPRARNIGADRGSTGGEPWYQQHLADAEASDRSHGAEFRIREIAPVALGAAGLKWTEPWMAWEMQR